MPPQQEGAMKDLPLIQLGFLGNSLFAKNNRRFVCPKGDRPGIKWQAVG